MAAGEEEDLQMIGVRPLFISCWYIGELKMLSSRHRHCFGCFRVDIQVIQQPKTLNPQDLTCKKG